MKNRNTHILIDSEIRIRSIGTVRGKVRVKVIRKKANFVQKEERMITI